MIRIFEPGPGSAQRQPSPALASPRERLDAALPQPAWLSAVPSVEAHPGPDCRLISDPGAPAAQLESFRLLAHRMETYRRDHAANRLIVTSAIPGEGKTFVASNLAITLARQRGSVLLIDGDIRGARLEHALGLPRQSGLSELLAGSLSLSQALRKAEPHGVFVLGAGKFDFQTPDLLAGGRFAELLREIKDIFRWIVVDAPPLLPVVDALAMTRAADAALLVARRDHTPRPALDRALLLLRQHPLAGVVFNDAADRSASTYYSYKTYSSQPAPSPTPKEDA